MAFWVVTTVKSPIDSVKKSISRQFSTAGKCMKISELLGTFDLHALCGKRKHEKFPAPSMMKLLLFMRLKGIKFQTRLLRYLEKNSEDAKNLGFRELPDQRTLSHFMRHIMSNSEWVYLNSIIDHIEKCTEKFGVSLDMGVKKAKVKRKFCRKTFHNRKNRKLDEICRFARKKIYPRIDFNLGKNSVYMKNKFIDLLLSAGTNNDFAENTSNKLNAKSVTMPNADTFLYHVKKSGKKRTMTEKFSEASDFLWNETKACNLFRNRKHMVSIDYTYIPFYGDRSTSMVVGKKPEKGTSFGFCFATLNVIEAGRRMTLDAVPVGTFDSMDRVVERLLKTARKKIKISCVCLDRGFFSADVIKKIDSMGFKFIMPAIRNEKIKRLMESMPVPYAITDYEMGDCTFNLVFAEGKKDREGNRMKICFATNIGAKGNNRNLAENLVFRYNKRWGIETSYRVIGDFRARTTSVNYLVRLFYFMFSVIVYNLWVVANALIILSLLKREICKPVVPTKFFCSFLLPFVLSVDT